MPQSIIFVVCLPRQKTCFVATNTCLSRQTRVCGDKSFVATKIILVAVPASDSQQQSHMIQKRCTFWWITAYMIENEPQSTKLNVMIILSKTGLFATRIRLAGTIKRYALHSYVGTIFSHEFSILQHVLCWYSKTLCSA